MPTPAANSSRPTSRRLTLRVPSRRYVKAEKSTAPAPYRSAEYASGWNPCSSAYLVTVKLNAQSRTVTSSISSTTDGRRITRAFAAASLPLLLLTAAFLSGGFAESTYSLLAAATWLGLAIAFSFGGARRPSAAALLLLGLGMWTSASVLWGATGPALRIAPLVALYAGALVAAELVDAELLLVGVSGVCSAIVCAGLAARCADAGFALAGGAGSQRLDWPLGYANGLGLVAVVSVLLGAGLPLR